MSSTVTGSLMLRLAGPTTAGSSARSFPPYHGFADGWPGYIDGGYAAFASDFVDGTKPSAVTFPSEPQIPVVVGIREAPAAQPAIIVIGHNGVRGASKAKGAATAKYAASGPLISARIYTYPMIGFAHLPSTGLLAGPGNAHPTTSSKPWFA